MKNSSINKLVYNITGGICNDLSKEDFDFRILSLHIQLFLSLTNAESIDIKDIEEHKKNTKKYLSIMNEYKWPPIYSMPYDSTIDIVNEYKTLSSSIFKNNLNEKICKFFNENLKTRILANWKRKQYFKNRIHILEEMINGHLSQYYFLTIPVAFSQIEGILAEINNHAGLLKTKDINIYLDNLLKKDSSWDLNFKKTFIELSYQHFLWGERIPEMSRHSVMHGADKNYGNEINSVKAIAYIDYLSCITD